MSESTDRARISSSRIAFLDLLRIFAFLSVLIGHKFYWYFAGIVGDPTIHATPRFAADLVQHAFYGGGAGVVVFFFVSGYIITHVLQTEQPAEFLIRRFFRIYPLYIVALAIHTVLLAMADAAPPVHILLLQALLIGDFFNAPNSLAGAEWTLRIEVMFYLFMAALHTKPLAGNRNLIPYAFVATVVLCRIAAPIPSAGWTTGYFTINAPLLLLGSMMYLFEKKRTSLTFLIAFGALVYYHYYSLIAVYQKNLLGTHFAAVALGLFVGAWALRRQAMATAWIVLLSDMTYAVYLFHNWMFDDLRSLFAYLKISIVHPYLQAVIALFVVCFLMTKYVEKPAIRAGRAVVTALRRRRGGQQQRDAGTQDAAAAPVAQNNVRT